MQVVQPYPTRLKPNWSRYVCSPVWFRYSVTTREPGASDALTSGLTCNPRSTAFFASNPAASITDGLLVLVQLVIAAINTLPCRMFPPCPSAGTTPRLGVGRLFVISNSVCGFVLCALDSFRITGSWLPPPAWTQIGRASCRERVESWAGA